MYNRTVVYSHNEILFTAIKTSELLIHEGTQMSIKSIMPLSKRSQKQEYVLNDSPDKFSNRQNWSEVIDPWLLGMGIRDKRAKGASGDERMFYILR